MGPHWIDGLAEAENVLPEAADKLAAWSAPRRAPRRRPGLTCPSGRSAIGSSNAAATSASPRPGSAPSSPLAGGPSSAPGWTPASTAAWAISPSTRTCTSTPRALLEGAGAAIVVADLYAARGQNADAPLDPGRGRIARYARGRDYHVTIKRRLHRLCDELRADHAGAEFRAFTDTAPVPERELAGRAGLGWIGKHTLLIDPRLGSYLLLGGVLTTLEIEPPATQTPVADHCGTCTRCVDACPTDAITPYTVDASRSSRT